MKSLSIRLILTLTMSVIALSSFKAFALEPGDELNYAGLALSVGGAVSMGGGGYFRDISDAVLEVARNDYEAAKGLNFNAFKKVNKYARRVSVGNGFFRGGFSAVMIGAGEMGTSMLIKGNSKASDSLEKVKRPETLDGKTNAEKLAEGLAPL